MNYPFDAAAQVHASAREWHKLQLGVLGFVGLCGVLRGDSGSGRPLWLQDLSGIAALAGLVLRTREGRDLARQRPVLPFPFHASAVHDPRVRVTEQLEYPEGVAGPPVRLVAVEDHGVIRSDAPPGNFSSPGWKSNFILPSNSLRNSCSMRAAPSNEAVCTSCPQACITPSFLDL